MIQVRVPPLRDRLEDLMPLVQHFLAKHARTSGRSPNRLDSAAMEALRRHDWPGNVRELENAIERALVLGRGEVLGVGDLPASARGRGAPAAPATSAASLADVEREHIVRALGGVGGNRAAAARVLGVDRKTLYRKLRQYGLA